VIIGETHPAACRAAGGQQPREGDSIRLGPLEFRITVDLRGWIPADGLGRVADDWGTSAIAALAA
jgi:hypothetical protein